MNGANQGGRLNLGRKDVPPAPQRVQLCGQGLAETAVPHIQNKGELVFFNIKVRAEKLPLVLPPKDGAYLKDRFRLALLGPES